MGSQTYSTAGVFSFTGGTDCPANVTQADAILWQSGAAGAGANLINNGGGGSGGKGRVAVSTDGGRELQITIPAAVTSGNPGTAPDLYDVSGDQQLTNDDDGQQLPTAGGNGVGGVAGSFTGSTLVTPLLSGGDGDDAAGTTSGGGGGGSAGTTLAGTTATNATGAVAPTGGGNGGNGGAALANGSNGSSPGGGGGGAGDGASVGGSGGLAKVILNWLTITSGGGGTTANINAAENQTAVTTVVASGAGTPSYAFSGVNADEELFSINSSSGVIVFNIAPDFENPQDLDTDNVYNIVVDATDGFTTSRQTINVTVTDVNESTTSNAPVSHSVAFANSDSANFLYNLHRENLL